jgi:hypothetical protein
MSTLLATIVDVGALWRTVWTAAIAGLLVTVCCSFAVLGGARASEPGRGPGWVVLGLAGTLATGAVVVYGVLLVVA